MVGCLSLCLSLCLFRLDMLLFLLSSFPLHFFVPVSASGMKYHEINVVWQVLPLAWLVHHGSEYLHGNSCPGDKGLPLSGHSPLLSSPLLFCLLLSSPLVYVGLYIHEKKNCQKPIMLQKAKGYDLVQLNPPNMLKAQKPW